MNRILSQRSGALSTDSANARALDGERKVVTVLFADIVQSSRLIADTDPEEADDRLLTVLQEMTKSVRRYGGTVNQVLGDGVMALFGVPRAQEDHALRACLAAQAMHAAVARSVAGTHSAGQRPAAIRVGLSSGEVVVNPPDDRFDRKFRAVGEPVYLAQRLEQAAPPGSTLLSRATLTLAAEKLAARPFGEVRLKPESHPVEAFELSGIRFDYGPFKRLSRAGPISFIGRTEDLEALRVLLDEVEGGRGRVLAITGEAGIGKSRLVFEFLQSVRDRWVRTISCDLLPPGLARRHGPLAWVVTRLLPSHAANGAELPVAAEELLQSLEIEGRYARAAICDLLDLDAGDAAWAGLDPPARLQILIETVCEIVCAISRRQPLVLVFEDFHWADTETRRFGEELAQRIESSRVLLIVTARSHHEKSWESWHLAAERDIGPLSRTQTAEFLDVLLGPDPKLDDIKDLLVEKTQGNPFFLEECVRALEEAGDLAGASGAYRLTVPIAELEIPGSVHDVLAARIDALPAPERTVLLRASVIGQRVDVDLLGKLQRESREAVLALLTRLEQAGFLERTRIVPNLEYSFRHALTHDVAYGTLLKRIRRYLHARVMAAISKRRIAQLPNKVELLAYHALHAEDWPKTLVYCRQAGRRAQKKSANREALDFFNHALRAIAHNPQSPRYFRREIDLRLDLVQSLLLLGQYEAAERHLLRAERLAKKLGDKRRYAKAASMMALYHWWSGSMPQAIQVGRAALDSAEALDDFELEVPCLIRLGAFSTHRGDYSSACEFFEAAIARIPEDATHKPLGLLGVASAGCLGQWAQSLGELGCFEEALRIADESIRIADESEHEFSQVHSRLSAGYALLRKGDFDRSIPILKHSFALSNTMRLKSLLTPNAVALGFAFVRSGQVARGLEYLEEAFKSADRQALLLRLSLETSWLAEAYLVAGRIGNARKLAADALRLAKSNGEKGHEAWAQWLLGEISLQHDVISGNQAEARLHEAHDIAVIRFMRPLVAHIEFGLGRWHCRRKTWDKALMKLESAISLYRELDMNYWRRIAETNYAAVRGQAPVPVKLS